MAAVFLIAGISGPVLTHMLPDLVRSQTSSNMRIIVGKQTAVDAIKAYLGNVSQLPMLAVILIAMGAIAEERSRGIAELILYRPVSRAAYLLAKATAYSTMTLAAIALGAIAAFYYTALLFSSAPFGPFLLINLGLALTAMDIVALTLLCSTVLRSGIAAGGAAFVLYLLYGTLPKLWGPVADSLPSAITNHAPQLLSGVWGAADVIRPLLGGLVLGAACLVAAYTVLRRQEV